MAERYDLLMSTDVLVDDPDACARAWVGELGLPEPREAWITDYADSGYRAIFARTRKWLGHAPTQLEIIGPAADAPPEAIARRVLAAQAPRPLRTHATVLASSRLPEVLERLREGGLRHWFDPEHANLPNRIFVGCESGSGADYEPHVDGGLRIEIIDTAFLRLPPEAFTPAPPPPDPEPGELVRILEREFLVADLDATLQLLAQNLAWEPTEQLEDDEARRATLATALARSARFRLVEPTDPRGAPGRYLARWGEGPYTTRIGVRDLEARARELRARGTPFEQVSGVGDRLRVTLSETCGVVLELVELAA